MDHTRECIVFLSFVILHFLSFVSYFSGLFWGVLQRSVHWVIVFLGLGVALDAAPFFCEASGAQNIPLGALSFLGFILVYFISLGIYLAFRFRRL